MNAVPAGILGGLAKVGRQCQQGLSPFNATAIAEWHQAAAGRGLQRIALPLKYKAAYFVTQVACDFSGFNFRTLIQQQREFVR